MFGVLVSIFSLWLMFVNYDHVEMSLVVLFAISIVMMVIHRIDILGYGNVTVGLKHAKSQYERLTEELANNQQKRYVTQENGVRY